MQFFTRQWLRGELTDDAFDAAPNAYRLHLTSLRHPADVTGLSQADLHDARLLEVLDEPHASRLTLRLCRGDLQRGYTERRISYAGAATDAPSLAHLRRAAESPRDEILYDEVDRVRDRFEHRLIFTSNEEVCVSFDSVALTARPVAGRAD